jgi:hypothetical protein
VFALLPARATAHHEPHAVDGLASLTFAEAEGKLEAVEDDDTLTPALLARRTG